MSSSQTTFLFKLQSGTDQDMRGRFIARMAWPPRADIVSSSPIGWGTRSLDQTCAHCTFSTRFGSACILFYGSDLCTLHIFSAQSAQPGARCTLHISFSSHRIALDIVHCSFQLSEKLKLRASHQLHPVRLAKLVIFIRADNFIFLEKFIKWGGGSTFKDSEFQN